MIDVGRRREEIDDAVQQPAAPRRRTDTPTRKTATGARQTWKSSPLRRAARGSLFPPRLSGFSRYFSASMIVELPRLFSISNRGDPLVVAGLVDAGEGARLANFDGLPFVLVVAVIFRHVDKLADQVDDAAECLGFAERDDCTGTAGALPRRSRIAPIAEVVIRRPTLSILLMKQIRGTLYLVA